MKKLEFETSKGRFLVVDGVGEDFAMDLVHMVVADEWFIKLSEIPEEEASEIVDEDNEYGVRIFQNYQTTSMQYFDEQITAIESLHSLLKSKGIKITNNTYIFKL